MESFLVDLSPESGEEDEGDEPLPAAAKPAPVAAPSEPAPVAATPTPPVAPTPQPPTPEATPAQPVAAQPATPTPEQPAPQPELSPEQVHERFKQWREQGIELLATKHYALPPEQVKEFVDEGLPEKFVQMVPRIASQVYMDVVTAAMGQVTQHLPALIERVMEARTLATKGEDEFFGAWPALKPHRDTVMRVAQAYRHQNPKASRAQFVQEVGASVMMALRMAPTPPAGTPATPTPTSGQPAHAAPFRPAAAARPASPPPVAGPVNPFTQMAEEDLADQTTVEDV